MKETKTIGLFLKVITNNFECHKNKNLEKLNLTSSQAHILMYLLMNQDKKINQRDIERKFNLSNPTVNGILNRLESKQFIVRNKSENDARVRELHLTEKALDLKREMKSRMVQVEKETLSALTKEEQQTLHTLLKKIVDNINLQKGGKQ